MWVVGSIYVVSVAINTIEYYNMKTKLSFYTEQFTQLTNTISTLKKAEAEFKRLLSFGSKEKILENVDAKINIHDAGSLDMDLLKDQIKNTVERVAEIQDFLKNQKDIYISTPKGWPIMGRITSEFGKRENPIHGGMEFHFGLDIATHSGTPVKATADGIVSFSGWSAGNGNLVVIEHGFGYSTLYAHNSSNAVKVGQRIKRGDIIANVGSTGNTTGPHLHYEIWHNGKPVNPIGFIKNNS
jgi:murein DD-endopeptidase MepM/ murein hydrolase activator NlpD